MSLFFDSISIWFVLTFAVGACSAAWYLQTQTKRNFIIALLLPVLTLALGLALFYGVDTDRKSIIRVMDTLVAAIEQDKPEEVCNYISPRNEVLRQLVRTSMGRFDFPTAKYHNLVIEIYDTASPPIVRVSFSVTIYWRIKTPIIGIPMEKPIPERAKIEMELSKTQDSWQIVKLDHNFRHSP